MMISTTRSLNMVVILTKNKDRKQIENDFLYVQAKYIVLLTKKI